jgi:membrane protein DedA with SNARE-associated domain
MLDHLIEYIQAIIAEYGAWGVFVATILEEVVAPIPSPLVPLAGGFFGLDPSLSWTAAAIKALFTVALPVTVGLGLGSAAVYAVGYYGGKPIIDRYKKFLGLSWEDIDKVERRLTKGRSDELILLALRIVPIVPGVGISGFFGLVRYPFVPFIVITLIGAFIRAWVLALVGWQVGELYEEFSGTIERLENYILIGVAIVGLAVLSYYFLVRRNKSN